MIHIEIQGYKSYIRRADYQFQKISNEIENTIEKETKRETIKKDNGEEEECHIPINSLNDLLSLLGKQTAMAEPKSSSISPKVFSNVICENTFWTISERTATIMVFILLGFG